jgi:hypothetical protein
MRNRKERVTLTSFVWGQNNENKPSTPNPSHIHTFFFLQEHPVNF